ncbi:MAG: hypothetical protein R3E39_27680 [Anaerolineae bacterium]
MPDKKRDTHKGKPIQQATDRRWCCGRDTLNSGELVAYTAIDTFAREATIVIRVSLQASDGKVGSGPDGSPLRAGGDAPNRWQVLSSGPNVRRA